MAITYTTQSISKQSDSTSYPIYPTRGGYITIDEKTEELFFQIMVGNTGSVIVQSIDGENRYYPLVVAGALLPAAGQMIVSAATIDGQAVTTSASNIWWYGGK